MFHVGKVLKVFRATDKDIVSSDASTQALLLMWDENLVTVTAKATIGSQIKENDIVLVDYSPSSPNIPVPKQIATNCLQF